MKDASARSGGDRLAAVLQGHGITHLFTLCGGHISPILVAARARGLRIVDLRHEADAVFAADAWARLAGRPGVAAVTAGPGVSNALTALKNAQLAQSPLVLIGGAAPTLLQGRGALQDIAQVPLVASAVKACLRVRRVSALAPSLARALHLAASGVPGPVFVECPVDLLYPAAIIRSWYAEAAGRDASLAGRLRRWYLRRHAERLLAADGDPDPARKPREKPAPVPARPLRRCAEALAGSRRPLLLIGSQALTAATENPGLAEAVARLGLPVYLSGMARGLLGRAHPLQRFHHRREALREADCVLLAGVPCDFRLDYGRHVRRQARLFAFNLDRREARLNRRPEAAVIGHPATLLRDLSALAATSAPGDWLARLAERDAGRDAAIRHAAEGSGADGVHPLALCRAIEREAGENAVFVADGGDFVGTAAYVLRPRRPLSWLDPGVFGTLGVGGGFALGAAMARADAEIWMLWGDGACGFSLIEFDSFVRHRVPVIAVVGNDGGWTQIAREQGKLLGDDVGTVLARSDYHRVAEGLGGAGLLLDDPQRIGAVLAEARRLAQSGRPVLVNALLARSDFREGSLSM